MKLLFLQPSQAQLEKVVVGDALKNACCAKASSRVRRDLRHFSPTFPSAVISLDRKRLGQAKVVIRTSGDSLRH